MSANITLRLDRLQSLFTVPNPDYFSDTAGLVPGVERLMEELRPQRLNGGVRTTIELPAGDMEPGLQERIASAISRWSQAQLRGANHRLAALRGEGIRALAIGLVIFAVGLALAQLTNRSGLPESIRVFLGDGVFLVAAWVGLWYPLDTLIYTPLAIRRERRVLQTIMGMEIELRPLDEGHETDADRR